MILKFNEEELKQIIKNYYAESASQEVDVKISTRGIGGVKINVSGERNGMKGLEKFDREVEKIMLDGIIYTYLKKKGFLSSTWNFDREMKRQVYGVGENLKLHESYELNGGIVVNATIIEKKQEKTTKKTR